MKPSATDSGHWLRANELFEQVLDLPAAERDDLLDRACAGMPGLREAVEQRLHADARACSFLDEPIAPSPELPGHTDSPSTRTAESMPRRLGSYRLIHELGQGGMGTVYAAERDDGAYQRTVAIKVIRAGAESEDVIRRLHDERHILALLDHPNIAAIYDGGATSSGHPYIVMERVEGEPIDRYCANRQLGIRQRVALMAKVCSAVDYAHRNLVVHRDLKPTNILVTPAGEPKLLDFGIAKVLDADAHEREGSTASNATAPWRQRLTLNYASPEQIRGEPVSTASDVYALGVLLFRVLTGMLPHSLDGLSPWQAEDHLCHSKTPRPSTMVDGRTGVENMGSQNRDRLRRQLRGDLDPIVLQALEKDPEARYRSAGALADDLERFQHGFPVRARRGGLRYRTAKLLRRHRLAATLTAAALALGMAFLMSVITSERRLARSEQHLLAEQGKREALLDFLLGIFEEAGPYASEGVPVTVREAVDRQVARLDRSFDEQPAVLATVLSTLGWVYLDLGEPAQAERFHQRALTVRRAIAEESIDVADSLEGVGAAQRDTWQGTPALENSTAALAIARRQRGAQPQQLLRCLNNHVHLLCTLNDWASADPFSAEALSLARGLPDTDSRSIAWAANQRALVLRNLGDTVRARSLYLETHAHLQARYSAPHPDLATLYNNLGRLEAEAEHHSLAIAYWRQADRHYAAAFGETYYDRIIPLTSQGRLLFMMGNPTLAETVLREAIDVGLRSPAIGPESEIGYIGRPAVLLGQILASVGRCADVRALLADRIDAWSHRPDHPVVQQGQALLADCISRHFES